MYHYTLRQCHILVFHVHASCVSCLYSGTPIYHGILVTRVKKLWLQESCNVPTVSTVEVCVLSVYVCATFSVTKASFQGLLIRCVLLYVACLPLPAAVAEGC